MLESGQTDHYLASSSLLPSSSLSLSPHRCSRHWWYPAAAVELTVLRLFIDSCNRNAIHSWHTISHLMVVPSPWEALLLHLCRKASHLQQVVCNPWAAAVRVGSLCLDCMQHWISTDLLDDTALALGQSLEFACEHFLELEIPLLRVASLAIPSCT